jgi:glycosyltransferase involved in cell wall biosynthesis
MSLANQSVRDFEVIVVDGGSTDETVKIARKHHAKVVVARRAGIARAGNIGSRVAQGKIIAFTQADTIVPADWLPKIMAEFERDSALIAITGPLEVPSDAPLWVKVEYKLWNMVRFLSSKLPDPLGMFFTSGPNIAVRRWAFEQIGGFNEFLPVHEDGTLGKMLMRLGKVKFCGPIYMPIWVTVSPRRATLGFGGLNRHYLYILGDLFPFNVLFPKSVWTAIRMMTWIDLLRARKLSEVEIRKRVSVLETGLDGNGET